MDHLKQQAKEILSNNWRSGFTIPTAKLYPFQWNWDSGFVAMGFAQYDVAKAMQELQNLFSGNLWHYPTTGTWFCVRFYVEFT